MGSVPLAYPRESSSPLATDTDTSSSSSSDNESNSSESMAPPMPGMFDGTADCARKPSMGLSYGGGMALDQQSSKGGKYHPRRSPYTGQNLENADAKQSGSFSGAPIRYDQLDGPSDAQNWENQAVPNSNWENQVVPNSKWENRAVPNSNWENRAVPDSAWQNHDNTKSPYPSSGSVRHGMYEPSMGHSGSQNRVSQSSPRTRAQRTPSGNESHDRFSTSNRSNKSPTGNAANRASPISVWTQPQQPPTQAAPAVVINVSHGTPPLATFNSPASNQAMNSESAKTHRDKIDEYLAGANQSPEGTNQSRTSTQSNNSQVWPTQNYDQTNGNSNQTDNAHQWHNLPDHEAVNQAQWHTVENTDDIRGQHGDFTNQNNSFPWDNNIIGSQPLQSSSIGAQNIGNYRSSYENKNASNHIARDAGVEQKQAPFVNSATSVHSIPQGQVQQQPSSSSTYKATFPNHTWRNDAPNSQDPVIKTNEATQHISPQPGAQDTVEPNNQASRLLPQTAFPKYDSSLPLLIDPRPRPHWYIWKPPQRPTSFSKAEVPRVEPAEPLNYVPSEVAQRNQMSHQVYLSQPAEYVHKRASPRYMDDFSRPYAVFIFKYRSKGNAAGIRH